MAPPARFALAYNLIARNSEERGLTMDTAKVYYTNLRTYAKESQLDKLRRLILRAGIEQIDFENKFVAIKIHFGELGNLSFLRPNYARVVADVVKELGGKPFLTDCNTLYVGSRKNALEHIDCAPSRTASRPTATGCQVIIADGLQGHRRDPTCPCRGGEYVQEAKIGHAIMDADIFISLTHFKGHEQRRLRRCIKNIGMGCGSPRGQDGAALGGQAERGPREVRRLPRVRAHLRARCHRL